MRNAKHERQSEGLNFNELHPKIRDRARDHLRKLFSKRAGEKGTNSNEVA